MNVLDHLSPHTFLSTQIDKFAKRRIGTCEWVLQSEIFQRWFRSAENSTLWCYGDRKDTPLPLIVNLLTHLKAGTGKTILSYAFLPGRQLPLY